ncbi:hypothetical protein [Bosea vestrisii]|uniref:Uncharacterized protein n=1 Tax=Bosea vestrisii TaxID=151416 RepID=A0ABW0H7B9_9HYPH
MPMDLVGAADAITRGQMRQVDVGKVNGYGFFNVASIGLSSGLAQSLDTLLKKRFGRSGCALAHCSTPLSQHRVQAPDGAGLLGGRRSTALLDDMICRAT